jgi:methionine sulfoxide reductase heme-binding subunit
VKANKSILKGWALVGVTAIVLVLGLAFSLLIAPNDADAARSAIRYTARVSVTLFLLAFTASAAVQFWPSAFTQWQRQNRRYLGVSFALSHFIHLAAILSLSLVAPAEFAEIPAATWILGGLAYLLIAAMTATSFDRTARLIGPKAWTVLHTVGAYYIWLVFANSFISRAFTMPAYIPVAVAVVGALGLRIAARSRRSRHDAQTVGTQSQLARDRFHGSATSE